MKKLEAHNALEHTPLQTQTDTIAGGNSPLEQALWVEHQKRMAEKLMRLKAAAQKPVLPPKSAISLSPALPVF